MAQEIERKFLVKENANIKKQKDTLRITQGYLSSVKERTVRVRIQDDKAFLTIKGLGNESEITRFEFEKEIDLKDARELLKMCEPGIIEKFRVRVPVGKHIFEVDFFEGDNLGLVLAEIELSFEDEEFERPEWLGEEVTGDPLYYNSSLSKKPFLHFSKKGK